jgi:hypothetical protein
MRAIIGTCGSCGGPVEAGRISGDSFTPNGETLWPLATCRWCGAHAKRNGPTMEMEERRHGQRGTQETGTDEKGD